MWALPSNGNELMLLNENGHPVEPGEVGEIVVRSRYLAAGYWRPPALTAERFDDDAWRDAAVSYPRPRPYQFDGHAGIRRALGFPR